jgi:hypothetical protein
VGAYMSYRSYTDPWIAVLALNHDRREMSNDSAVHTNIKLHNQSSAIQIIGASKSSGSRFKSQDEG